MSVSTPLVRPAQSAVRINPTAKSLEDKGFNFPTFRLLNKHCRSNFSEPYPISANTRYQLLAVSNSKGWFAGARFNGTTYELVFSTLEELRASQRKATETGDKSTTFKRTISLPQGKPNILSLANQDSCLIVGLEQGVIAVYDTSVLFTPGQDHVQPTHTQQLQSTPLKQIVANPGSEPNLVNLVAVVGDASVQIFNMQLEPQAGWTASDASTNPAAAAWSPKGKHIAVGLQAGDILTYALGTPSTVNKHIPPTFEGVLAGLNWTGPGHSFQATYSAPEEERSPALHIVSLDNKTNIGTYWNAIYPWGTREIARSPHLLQLPKWDDDDHKAMFVYGDSAAAELEGLAHDKQAWYQMDMDSKPVFPMDDNDTLALLSLTLDLTDVALATPVMFALYNDGTIQGWHLEHSKAYPLMVTPGAAAVPVQAPGAIQADASMSTEQEQPPKPTSSAFSQPTVPSAFGQPSFGSSSFGTSSFAKSAATGSTGGFASFAQGTSAFGQAATSQSSSQSSAFGGASTTPTSSPFGGGGAFLSAPAFGQSSFGNSAAGSAFGAPATPTPPPDMTREASMADATPGFGGMSLGSSNDSAANDSKPSIFGNNTTQAGTSSAFGSGGGSGLIKPASGFGFAASSDSPFAKAAQGATTPAFAQNQPPPALAAAPALTPAAKTGSGFGTSGFGQSAFGQSSFGKPAFGQPAFGQSAFSSTTPTASPAASTATGGFSAFANKPASFGSAAGTSASGTGSAFSSFAGSGTSSLTSALKSTTPDASPSAFGSVATSAFGALASQPTTNVFGTTFGAPVTPGKLPETPKKEVPGIASPSASPDATPKPFGQVATKEDVAKSAFGNIQSSPSAFRPAQGFGAFGSPVSPDSPFAKKPTDQTAVPVSVFAGLAASGAMSAASSASTTTPAFGAPSALGARSTFGAPATPATPTATPPKNPTSGGFGGFSGSSSPFSAFAKSGGSFTEMLKKGDETKGSTKEKGAGAKQGDEKGKEKDEPSIKGKAPEEDSKKPTSAGSSASLAADTSFGDISSAGSSFVDVRGEAKEDEEVEVVQEGEGEEEYDENEDPDYVPSEEDFSDDHDFDDDEEDDLPQEEEEEEEEGKQEQEEGEEEEEGESEGEGEGSAVDPAKVPLPRSESSTPVPDIKLDRAQGSTPPGTPEERPTPPAKSPSPTATSPPSLFGNLGIGRPRTQPKRSSPLANAPVSGQDDEDDQKPPPTPKPAAAVLPAKPPAGKAKDEAQKAVFGQPTSLFGAKPATSPPSPGSAPSSISGTPSSMGAAPFSLAPSTTSKPTSPPVPPTGFFSLNKPQATSPPTTSGGDISLAPPFSLPAFNLNNAATTKIPPPPSSLFGTPTAGSPAPLATPSSFLATPPATGSKPAAGFFASPPDSKPTTPGATSPPVPPPVFSLGGGNMFGDKSNLSVGALSGQQKSSFSLTPKAPTPPPMTPKRESVAPPELSMEEGMQKECALLIMNLEAELEELGLKAQQVNQRKEHLSRTAGGSWNRADLGDPGKWSLGDLKQFGQVLVKFSDELTVLQELREQIEQEVRSLKSGLLKANTRREEIARFNKAKTDPEFAKMLKTRTLGPEHSETQTQLRRSIRTMRDRIQRLEDNLQASKKKLAEATTGRPHIRAPTLDTLNRTFRNIEIALSQQADDVSMLAARLKKVDLEASSTPLTPARDGRLPDRQRRAYNITPNVAATTAAALNAERGANRLKKALLAVRNEPLLNVNVNAAKPPVAALSPERTPSRFATSPPNFPVTPISFSLPKSFPKFSEVSASPDMPEFSLPPDDDFSPSRSLPANRRGGGSSSKKHSSVQLPKKSPGTPSPAPSFDWGPLPSFTASTKNPLAASLTKK